MFFEYLLPSLLLFIFLLYIPFKHFYIHLHPSFSLYIYTLLYSHISILFLTNIPIKHLYPRNLIPTKSINHKQSCRLLLLFLLLLQPSNLIAALCCANNNYHNELKQPSQGSQQTRKPKNETNRSDEAKPKRNVSSSHPKKLCSFVSVVVVVSVSIGISLAVPVCVFESLAVPASLS